MVKRLRQLFSGVRLRVTAAAVLAVACAFGVSAAVVEVTLQHDRHNVLMTTARLQAQEVIALNQALRPPVNLPPTPSLQSGLIQVLYDGRVVGVSHSLHFKEPLWVPGDPMVQDGPALPVGPGHDVKVVAVPVKVGPDLGTVVVVVSLDQYNRTLLSVQRLLEIGLPILLAVVGFICWIMVGRALRRIEALRLEVADVTLRPGEHRVAEPHTDDEVGRLARTLNSMLDHLEASSARERRFVADASHELRSPIANIRTAVEVALHRPDTADWQRVADEVLVEDARMTRLVDELLLLARSDEGRLAPVGEPCDLLAVAQEVVLAGGYTDPPDVTMIGTPAFVLMPVGYVERVIANLVDNARRFAVSRVDVVIGGTTRTATLEVRDDGPGVPPEERDRVFDRFVRLDEGRDREHGGFGLGLAIVADLCRAYGGTIEVGGGAPGAVFSVRLPAAKPPRRPPAPRPSVLADHERLQPAHR
jgi:signal transduction histidine kinase